MLLFNGEKFIDIGPRERPNFLMGNRWFMVGVCLLVVAVVAAVIVFNLRPVGAVGGAQPKVFEIARGEGFSDIAKGLENESLIRSRFAFEIAAIASGRAFHIQPGTYELSAATSAFVILGDITGGGDQLVNVTIPEGSNIYQIDAVLSENSVIHAGELIALNNGGDLEGKLFPDTYQFFKGSDVAIVEKKFLDNFNDKAEPFLKGAGVNEKKDLIVASILEKEVQGQTDQEMVAGILAKRLAAGMRLQLDATVCYAKQITEPKIVTDCTSLTHIDFTPSSSYNSAYNTYLHIGLPPGPIGNPGTSSIMAAMHPVSSLYWYYLSDPVTGKTIYAKTLAEQDANIRKYLKE